MSLSPDTIIATTPQYVYHALLNPQALAAWWGCTAIIEPQTGGLWALGWGADAESIGNTTVVKAEISELKTEELLQIKLLTGEKISFEIEAHAQGALMRIAMKAADGTPTDANLESWLGAAAALKNWTEANHPYTPPAPAPIPEPAPVAPVVAPVAPVEAAPVAQAAPTPATPAPAADPAAGVQGASGVDPYAAATKGAVVEVLDEGGFGVTDPNAVIKSWSPEQGFGYATHAQLGDVVFDYDGCDFEPAPGDKVLLLVIGKNYAGKPKIKRIACLAKGSNIK